LQSFTGAVPYYTVLSQIKAELSRTQEGA